MSRRRAIIFSAITSVIITSVIVGLALAWAYLMVHGPTWAFVLFCSAIIAVFGGMAVYMGVRQFP